MHRCILGFVLLLCAGVAQASQFQISPSLFAVDRGQHSGDLTISYLPGSGISGAEVEVGMKLDAFGWVQIVPAASTSNHQVDCRLSGGRVVALVFSVNSTPLSTWNAIPVCRVQVRPHLATARGNYFVTLVNAIAWDVNFNPRHTTTNYARAIVE